MGTAVASPKVMRLLRPVWRWRTSDVHLHRPQMCRAFSHSASLKAAKHPDGFVPPQKEDLSELRERVQEFTRREIPPELAHQIDISNEFPSGMFEKLGDAGLLGPTASEKYGGLGWGYQAHCVILEELSRASASIALSYAAHSQLCVNQLMLNGTEEQKARFLPDLISGRKIGALAMSEHSAGSDVVSMRMTAKQVDGGYVLDGTKMWITNGPDAEIIIVYAKTSPEAGSKGITAFILDNPKSTTGQAKGFSVARKLDKLGMRGSNTGELIFDSVFIPDADVLGDVNKGAHVLMEGLDLERLVLSAGPIGIMQSALDLVLPYIFQRKQFGEPIGTKQLVQGKVADMYTKLRASQALTHSVARQIDEAHDSPDTNYGIVSRDCTSAILFAAEAATACALDAIQLMGGAGYMNEVPAGRLLRDAKLYEIGAGTSEIRRMVIGRSFQREFG